MKFAAKIITIVSFFFSTLAHAGTTIPKFAIQNQGKKIAIVSLSANNWSNSLNSINSKETSVLMDTQINQMVRMIEEKFTEKKLQVIPVEQFIAKDEFQVLAGDQREVALPSFEGHSLPLMAANRKQMVKCRLDKDRAIKLTEATGADFVAVVYSEWAVKTGKMVPTSKALAKNVIGIYDTSGKQVYFGRSDKMGNATLGAFGTVAVNEGTIKQWAVAYEKGLNALFAGKR